MVDKYSAVSYTHLDVYKRQRLSSQHKKQYQLALLTRLDPVSYTHLDVYKRQLTLHALSAAVTMTRRLMHS